MSIKLKVYKNITRQMQLTSFSVFFLLDIRKFKMRYQSRRYGRWKLSTYFCKLRVKHDKILYFKNKSIAKIGNNLDINAVSWLVQFYIFMYYIRQIYILFTYLIIRAII